ncbi:MAG: LCP family protein [Lachnospiraceae bacterium]|nr:LCP family protein [Lachnospiraceae bacterium]
MSEDSNHSSQQPLGEANSSHHHSDSQNSGHHHSGRRHSKKKKIYSAVASVVIVIGAILFVKTSIETYKERKAVEAQIAAKQQESEAAAGIAGGTGANLTAQGGAQVGAVISGNGPGNVTAGQEIEVQWESVEESLPELEEKIEKDGKSYELNPNLRTVLILGVDKKDGFQKGKPSDGGQSDAIFLVIQDVTTKKIKILTIPRDTITNIKIFDLAGNYVGKAQRQITLAYSFGDGMELSCQLAADAVSELLGGVQIDDYMAITVGALPILNEQVGGVTVHIDDPYLEQRNPNLKYNSDVTLVGNDAEDFLRIRNIEEDNTALSRMDRHMQFMNAWMAAAHKAAAADDTFGAKLMNAIQPYMITSMPKDQYLKLGLDVLLSQDGLAQSDRYTLPGTPQQGLLHDEYILDDEAAKAMVQELFYRPLS